jgi:hypothetical protein
MCIYIYIYISMYVTQEERCLLDFGREPRGKEHLVDVGIVEHIVLKWIFKK